VWQGDRGELRHAEVVTARVAEVAAEAMIPIKSEAIDTPARPPPRDTPAPAKLIQSLAPR